MNIFIRGVPARRKFKSSRDTAQTANPVSYVHADSASISVLPEPVPAGHSFLTVVQPSFSNGLSVLQGCVAKTFNVRSKPQSTTFPKTLEKHVVLRLLRTSALNFAHQPATQPLTVQRACQTQISPVMTSMRQILPQGGENRRTANLGKDQFRTQAFWLSKIRPNRLEMKSSKAMSSCRTNPRDGSFPAK